MHQELIASFDSKLSPNKKSPWLFLFMFESILAYKHWMKVFCLGAPDADDIKKPTLAIVMNCYTKNTMQIFNLSQIY